MRPVKRSLHNLNDVMLECVELSDAVHVSRTMTDIRHPSVDTGDQLRTN